MSDLGITDLQLMAALNLATIATLIIGFIIVAHRLSELGDRVHQNFRDSVSGIESSVRSIEREVTKESRGSAVEAPLPVDEKQQERLKKEREQWVRTQIESTWGGWRKARLVCRRYIPDAFDHEYTFIASDPDRTYRARAGLFPRWQLKLGELAEYAIDPNGGPFYLRVSPGEFATLKVVEEKIGIGRPLSISQLYSG